MPSIPPLHSIADFWRWSAKWNWQALGLVVGLGLITVSEYAGAIVFFSLAAWGAVSKVAQGTSSTVTKVAASIGIVIVLAMAAYDVNAERGNKPWSHLQPPIEGYMAETWYPMSADAILIPALPQRFQPPHAPAIEWVPIPPMNIPRTTSSLPPEPVVVMGEVQMGIGLGDDNAVQPLIRQSTTVGDVSTMFSCVLPFTCYSEDTLRSQYVPVVVGEKKWARIFFLVANTGTVSVSRPDVHITSQTAGVSLYRQSQRTTTAQPSIEIIQPETLDLVPFSTSNSSYDYVADVTVDDGVSYFAIAFVIFSPNLKARHLVVAFHVIR
jgi:hypothetical protein